MLTAYWIIAGVLALAYLIVGALKVVRTAGALVEFGMLWVKDVPRALVRVIGLLEIAGAVGLAALLAVGNAIACCVDVA